MLVSLLLTALLMGLAGGPHCVAMCGAATAGIGCTSPRLWAFQGGRVLGYALLGAAVAASAGVLQWAATHAALLKPFWAMLQLAILALGLSLVWLGRQPLWLDRWAHQVWQGLRMRSLDWRAAPALAGLLWALLPCGLLYSALMVAALSSHAWQGGLVMAAFAAGSALGLHLGPALWRRWRQAAGPQAGHWGVRLAGLTVACAAAWALGHGLWKEYGALFCA
ncbi:MAG TPA: sulfite exporter TauE/SafE family protein [Methylibium sp.]